jgi:hypothetical protein
MPKMSPRVGALLRARRITLASTTVLALVGGSLAVAAVSAQAADELPATFLSTASTWKYSDNNTDPAAGNADRLVWTTDTYNDSSWKSGTGAFGSKAKDGVITNDLGAGFPVTTPLQHWIDATAASPVDVPTYHFRSDFSMTAGQLDAISGLSATLTYDDAVQVFVNGVKVAGFADDRVQAVADAQKNLTYAGVGAGDPATSTFTIPAAALHAGTNTVAIALYQDRATSSDSYLDLTSLAPVVESATSTTLTDIVLGVGGTQSERMVTWYSAADTAQVVEFAPSASLVDGAFPASSTKVDAAGGLTTSLEYNRIATLPGLAENTVYSYRVGPDAEGKWSKTYSFRTQAFDGEFDFLFFGDPQLGSSGNLAGDTAGWVDTLDVARTTYPDAEMLFSSGDQVEHGANESEYAAFLQDDALREVPFVATNGNHDVSSKAYEQHFGTPNTDRTAGAGTATASGGNYWFIYKDVLFMDINSNSRDHTAHIAWMNQVVAEHGDEAKWKVLAFHHSIYSTGPHAIDEDVNDRRNVLPTAISDLGIDLVLQGHDHSYARTYLIHNGEKADANEQAGADSVVAGPGGVLYVTANSASGSKYYEASASGSWWLSVSNQEKVRNYSAVEVTDTAITVKTLRSQAKDDSKPVNSVVDQVTLTRAADSDDKSQQLQVTVPDQVPGEFIWNIDGSNGVVDMGTAVDEGDHFAASGSINPISVTDTRATGPEWSISAKISDFASGDKTFAGKYLGWTPKVIEAGAGATAGAKVLSGFESGNGLGEASTLGSATAGHERGSAKLGADLDLQLPIDVSDGTYQATLTLTALS